MEWFSIANANLPASELQRHIRIDTLHEWCTAPPAIAGDAGTTPDTDWAHWSVHREVIRDGLRFTLPGTVQALQWTLTAGGHARPGTVSVHCTLNTSHADALTTAALERFMDDWRQGLEEGTRRLQQQRAIKSAAVCVPCASSGFG